MCNRPSEERVQITESVSAYSLCLACDMTHCKDCTGDKTKCVTCKDGWIVKGDNSGCDGEFIFIHFSKITI